MNISESGPWSLGTLIWMPTAVVLVIAAVVGGVVFWRIRNSVSDFDRGPAMALGIGLCVTAACLVIGTGVGMYPYSAEYHQWRRRNVSGTVDAVDKRIISGSDGSGPSDKFVIRYADGGAQFSCDDTRCAQVEQGDDLTLSCKRVWQYTGTDGYDCRFVSVTR